MNALGYGAVRRRREAILAATLLGIGAGGFTASYLVHTHQADRMVPRPAASGDVGFLGVYAQSPGGPVRLQPQRRVRLRRPQDIAFELDAEGTGPRQVRIELRSPDGRHDVVYEAAASTPARSLALDYVLHLDDRFPDELTLLVTVEAPHAMPYTSRYELLLEGASEP